MPTPRKSAAIHALTGTYRSDRHGPRTAHGTSIDPAPPTHLADEHLAAWSELVAAAAPYAMQSDRFAVEIAAVLLTKFRSGDCKAADIAHLRTLLDKLGCTPAGRRALDVVNHDPEEPNPFDQFDDDDRFFGGKR